MSAREWKPGDVAIVGSQRVFRHGGEFAWTNDLGSRFNPPVALDARPLVVIDPEDREQAYRMGLAFQKAFDDIPYEADNLRDEFGAASQQALREFANPTPPKPDEPTGLGAVVEDAEGRTWVRHDNTPGAFPWVRGGCGVLDWSEINVVRVLSEGWRA